MQIEANSPEDYISKLPEGRRETDEKYKHCSFMESRFQKDRVCILYLLNE